MVGIKTCATVVLGCFIGVPIRSNTVGFCCASIRLCHAIAINSYRESVVVVC